MKRLFELEESEFLSEVGMILKTSKKNLSKWRDEAVFNYGFVSGYQWDLKDAEKMRIEERPCVTFNRTEVNIDAVLGIDIDNEQDILAIPRDIGDTAVNEVVSSAIKYVRDKNYASQEESDIFYDLLITGVGAGEFYVDYSEDVEGDIIIRRVDPLEMAWDSSALRKNLLDARWVAREKRLDYDEIEYLWPKKAKELDISDGFKYSAQIKGGPGHVVINNPNIRYSGDNIINDEELNYESDGKIPVTELQWFEYDKVIRFIDPNTGKIIKMVKRRFDKVKDELNIGANFVELKEKVFYKAFFLSGVLLDRQLNASQKRFTYLFATGKRDRNQRIWYGMIRGIKDPQKWANKFFSSIIEIIGKNAKGGAFAESDAFVDIREAEEQWSKASPLIMLKRGGINKVKDRQVNNYPSGIERIMTFAIESIRDISGINVELLGLADRRQAGIVEQSRKQSGLAILSSFFKGIELFRVNEGYLIIELIREYFSPEKLIRIDLNNQLHFLEVQQIFSDADAVEYDVIVDQAPTSTSTKERTWFALQQVLPILLKQGIPIPPEVLDYAPIPASLAERWKQLLSSGILGAGVGSPGGTQPGEPTTSPQNVDEQNQVNQSFIG